MKRAIIHSVCECQARLHAELNEHKFVKRGWVTTLRGSVEVSPAHSIGPEQKEFYVAWLCPQCGRNTLRSFNTGALVFEAIEEQASA